MVHVHVFVERSPTTQDEDERAVRLAEAAVKRFPGRAAVVEHPLDDEFATELGVEASPTIAVNYTVLSVGTSVPAGRLVRFIESELSE